MPAGLTSYSTEVTLPSTAPGAGPDGLIVQISRRPQPGDAGWSTWTFTSLDAATLDVPANPAEGFLPPDTGEPEGEGFVSYIIQPNSGATTGTVIDAQAIVVFDTNTPITTATVSQYDRRDGADQLRHAAAGNHPSPSFTVSWSGSRRRRLGHRQL